MLAILLNDILPILLVAGVGFVLARVVRIDVSGLARVAFHALAPCLIFMLLVTSTASGTDLALMAIFCTIIVAAVGLVARLAALPFRLDRAALAGLLLAVMFSNGGNFGLALVEFAFGREALTLASMYFVTGAVLAYTVGVFLASSGSHSIGQSLRGIGRVPAVYAVIAAAIVTGLDAEVPVWVMRPVTLLGNASIPVMLLVLGMQLERTGWPTRPGVVAVAVAISLLVKPALALGLAAVLDLDGAARQASIVQSSMPAAVVATVIALEFDAAPDLVTSIVFYSTALSPFTLTLLVAWLQA
jgi:predicted permease